MLSAREVRSLLSKLCGELRFCLPEAAGERLERNPPTDAREFADAVFRAEGLDPLTADRQVYRQVKAVVADAFRSNREQGDADQ